MNAKTYDQIVWNLTARQRATLAAIREYVRQHGYAPSMTELGPLVGLASTSATVFAVDALVARGLLHKRPLTARSLTLEPREGDDADDVVELVLAVDVNQREVNLIEYADGRRVWRPLERCR